MNIAKVEGAFQPDDAGKFAAARGGMAATAFPEATAAAVEILEDGGNAVDAACAAALALCVCEPQACGIGGQSMALIHLRGETVALDGSSRAPSLAHIERLSEADRANGYRAATVPSTPAVLGYMSFRYGKLPWRRILEPAIRIAREGYRVTALQRRLQQRELDAFLAAPGQTGARFFLKDGAEPYAVGDLFRQPELADTLSYLAENDAHAFYTGDIAYEIDRDMRAHDGFLHADDLALIPWPVARKPVKARYRGVTAVTMPPPAAGRTLLLTLKMLGHVPARTLRRDPLLKHHIMAETFRKAFLNRRQRPFDPATYPQLPDKALSSQKHARELAKSIVNAIDPELPIVDPPSDDADTTHLSVMDAAGNAVGITQSIERVFGAKVATPGLGFLYNNYMMAFETRNPSHPYYLRPNAVPWSSVAPAIVFRQGKPWLTVGSPGSERIYSTVTQFLVNLIDLSMPMDRAMDAPRFHCSIGGKLSLEIDRFPPEVTAYLKEMGYRLIPREPYAFYHGAIHAVMKCQTRPEFLGAAEVRRDGAAGGPASEPLAAPKPEAAAS